MEKGIHSLPAPVFQRSVFDSGIASLANVLELSYEAAARLLARDPEGVIQSPADVGSAQLYPTQPGEVVKAIIDHGEWRPVTIATKEYGEGERLNLHTSEEVKRMLPGRRAVLLIKSALPPGAHYAAWTLGRLVNPLSGMPGSFLRNPANLVVVEDLNEVTINAAIVLYRRVPLHLIRNESEADNADQNV